MNRNDETPLLHIVTFAQVALAGTTGVLYNGYKQDSIGLIEKITLIVISFAMVVAIISLYTMIFNLKQKKK